MLPPCRCGDTTQHSPDTVPSILQRRAGSARPADCLALVVQVFVKGVTALDVESGCAWA